MTCLRLPVHSYVIVVDVVYLSDESFLVFPLLYFEPTVVRYLPDLRQSLKCSGNCCSVFFVYSLIKPAYSLLTALRALPTVF